MTEFAGISKLLPALEEEDVERLLAYVGEIEDLGANLDALMDYIQTQRPDLQSLIVAIARSYAAAGERTVEDVTTGVLTFLLLMDKAWADLYGDAWPVH
jgi:hypothetical protein